MKLICLFSIWRFTKRIALDNSYELLYQITRTIQRGTEDWLPHGHCILYNFYCMVKNTFLMTLIKLYSNPHVQIFVVVCLRFCIFEAKISFCVQSLVFWQIFTFVSVFILKLWQYKKLEFYSSGSITLYPVASKETPLACCGIKSMRQKFLGL